MNNKETRFIVAISFLIAFGITAFGSSQPVEETNPELGVSCYTVRSPFTDKYEPSGCYEQAGFLSKAKTAKYQPQYK